MGSCVIRPVLNLLWVVLRGKTLPHAGLMFYKDYRMRKHLTVCVTRYCVVMRQHGHPVISPSCSDECLIQRQLLKPIQVETNYLFQTLHYSQGGCFLPLGTQPNPYLFHVGHQCCLKSWDKVVIATVQARACRLQLLCAFILPGSWHQVERCSWDEYGWTCYGLSSLLLSHFRNFDKEWGRT